MQFNKPEKDLENSEIVAYIDRQGDLNLKTPAGMHVMICTDGKVLMDFEYNTWTPEMAEGDKTFSHGDKVEITL